MKTYKPAIVTIMSPESEKVPAMLCENGDVTMDSETKYYKCSDVDKLKAGITSVFDALNKVMEQQNYHIDINLRNIK